MQSYTSLYEIYAVQSYDLQPRGEILKKEYFVFKMSSPSKANLDMYETRSCERKYREQPHKFLSYRK